MAKKQRYILADIAWLETHLQELKKYVEANPVSSIKDRLDTVMSAKGTPVIKVIATKEVQLRELRACLKEVIIMLGEVERLREEQAVTDMEVRGGGEINGMMKAKLEGKL